MRSTSIFFTFRLIFILSFFFFSSRRRHTSCLSDWSSDVCSSDLVHLQLLVAAALARLAAAAGHVEGERARPQPQRLRARQIGRASCRERVYRSVGEEA